VKERELLRRISNGATQNIRFSDFVTLLVAMGFEERHARGSHRVFWLPGHQEILTLQPSAGEAKAYQVRQFQRLVEAYDLRLEDER
jgi:predicted RNA binding protein YcfA (HicA-like mRNA interferase family)